MYFSREFLRDGCSKTKFIGTTKRYARSCNRKRRKFLDYNARECFGSRYSVGCILHLHYKVFLRPPIEECGISVPRFFYGIGSSLARTMGVLVMTWWKILLAIFVVGAFTAYIICGFYFLFKDGFEPYLASRTKRVKNEDGSFNFVSGNNTSSCFGCMCDNFSNDYM